jgi:hypothetical protein
MHGGEFDEREFFAAIQSSGARALLIGRRALVVLGLPVLTADYDFWIAIDDIDAFNRAAATFALRPTKSPDEARRTGRYSLQNDEHVDVLIARSVTARSGEVASFDDLWSRRQRIELAPGVATYIPALDDLILTKRFALRPRDVEDIRLLETLRTLGTP